MKNLMIAMVMVAGACLAADAPAKKKYVDPNAYADYGPAMAAKPGDPMAVEWQNANDAALKAAAAPEALEAYVKDADAAKALLAKVKGAYSTDPMTLAVAAAVTQFVMQPEDCGWLCSIGRFFAFWRTCPRTVWTEALLARAQESKDVYVQMFCLDQLRWCGFPCQADKVIALGAAASDKSVKDFAAMVARELAK